MNRAHGTLRSAAISMAFAWSMVLSAQGTDDLVHYRVQEPTNWDCASAIRFCSDMQFTFTHSEHGQGCLYFYFVVDAGTVQVNANSQSVRDGHVQFFSTSLTEANMCDQTGEGGAPPCGISGASFQQTITVSGPHLVFLLYDPDPDDHGRLDIDVVTGTLGDCDGLDCPDCLPGFNPSTGRDYVVSAWCSVPGVPQNTSTYNTSTGPQLLVLVNNVVVKTITPQGPIIDGWQRMEDQFTLASGSATLDIHLVSQVGSTFFDDVRCFPAKASLKCMVYDPQTLRLDAELDERHYATFYEYDAEGKLTRVKKETERGIMPIQETRYNASHLDP
jgi:hypothetical protein